MTRRNNIILLIFGLLVLMLIGLFIFNKSKKFEWFERYKNNGKEPYDLALVRNLLKENRTDFAEFTKPLNETLPKLSPGRVHNLIIIKDYFNVDTAEVNALMNFAMRGNDVFIAANYVNPLLRVALEHGRDSAKYLAFTLQSIDIQNLPLPDSLYDVLDDEEYYWEDRDSLVEEYRKVLGARLHKEVLIDSVEVSYQTQLQNVASGRIATLSYAIRDTFVQHLWSYVRADAAEKNISIIGKDKKPAFVRYKAGNGSVYISSTPLLYTNYFMRQPEFFLLADEQFSHLKPGKILFDNVSRFGGFGDFMPKGKIGKSPLSFILSQPALTWAWYLAITGGLLFIAFGAKRKQRIIPIARPNLNTTLAYAKTLGSLQLREKNNTAKGNEIFNHFTQHLRTRNRWYGNEPDEELKNRLLKLAPDLKREIEIVMHLGTKCRKKQFLNDYELVDLFNYTQLLIARL